MLEADFLGGLGTVSVIEENYAAAENYYTEAIRQFESLTPPAELRVADIHNNLGNLLLRRGDSVAAQYHIEISYGVYSRMLGFFHPSVGTALNNLGSIHFAEGRLREAENTFMQALNTFAGAFGPEHPHVGVAHANLGDVYLRKGNVGVAKEHYDVSLHIFELAYGKEAGLLAYPLTGLGEVLFRQAQDLAAAATLQRALELPDAGDPELRGRTRFALAQVLAKTSASRSRGIELAEASRDAYASAGPRCARQLAEVERWIVAFRRSRGG